MARTLSIFFIAFILTACGFQQIQTKLFIMDSDTDPDVVVPAPTDPSENNGSFQQLLPYNEEGENENIEDSLELYRVSPILPEGSELQKCINSFIGYRGSSGHFSMIPMGICFDEERSIEISSQLANDLRVYPRIVARHPDNHILLLVPDGIRDQELARRRIRVVREFLIAEGINSERVIEAQDTPPE